MKGRNSYRGYTGVHKTAVVDGNPEIGQGTKIWHFCHIMEDAFIGDRCTLGQNVFVANRVVIGTGCKIQNNVSLYEGVTLHASVFISPSVVFTNVTNPRAAIERKTEFKKTIVQKGVSIGANATIICGITVGKYAFIGAGAVVTKDVPAYAVVFGNPARIRGTVDKEGNIKWQ